MILVNNQLARFLEDHNAHLIYRVVPPPARWNRIVELARRHGCTLPATPDARALADFLWQRKSANPQEYKEVSLAVLKLIGKGTYAVKPYDRENEGHFGLALADYTHSTAPNRRYIDLILQRILKAVLNGSVAPFTSEELAHLADHCSERESEARRIDRRIKKSAAATFLADHIGENYEGIVTAVKTRDIFVRLIAPPVDGRITGLARGIDVGDKVRVRLIAVDVTKGFIDFDFVEELST